MNMCMGHSTLTCKQQHFELPQNYGVPDKCSVPTEVGVAPWQRAVGELSHYSPNIKQLKIQSTPQND